jgi:hypothetical protein
MVEYTLHDGCDPSAVQRLVEIVGSRDAERFKRRTNLWVILEELHLLTTAVLSVMGRQLTSAKRAEPRQERGFAA